MVDTYPPSRQRPRLRELAAVIGTRANALRRDECGDWALHGKHGKVFAVPVAGSEGFQFVLTGRVKGWTYVKRELAFAKVTQDGDEGGSLVLDRMPSPDEAEPIRHSLGLAKKRTISPEERARLARHAFGKSPALKG